MKKLIAIMMVLVLAAFSFAGCGSKGNTSSKPESSAAESSKEESVETSVEESVEASVEESVEASVEESVEESIEASEESIEGTDAEASVEESAEDSVEESVEASVEESVEASVEESVEESVEASVEESVEASVEESVEASVEESVEASVEESVEESVEASVEESVEESSEESVDVVGPMAGGWEIGSVTMGSVSIQARVALMRAMSGYTGMNFEPVAELGTQIVNGINYMILCKGTAVVPDAQPALKVVIVSQSGSNSDRKYEILQVYDFDLGAYNTDTLTEIPEVLDGGFMVNAELKAAALEEEAAAVFEKATASLMGVNYKPLALIGTQVVAGINYAYLCSMTPVVPNAVPTAAILFVYAPVSGEEPEILNIANLDPAQLAQ